MAGTLTTPEGVLRVERETIEVTSNAPRKDPTWTFTDAHGHEHRWRESELPTLRWVVDETYWCPDCRDDHTEGHYECRECGEHVEPGMRGPSGMREFVPGRTSYFWNDEPITEERANEILAAARGEGA